MRRILTYFLFLVGLLLLACSPEKKSPKEKPNLSKPHPLTEKAYLLFDSKKTDSAFKVFNEVKDIYLKKRDSFRIASSLTYMAIIATESGDSFDGQELSIEALNFLNKKNKEHHPFIISNLNNLGVASYDLKKYKESIDFYSQSLPLIKDSSNLHTAKNNIANAYREEGNYAPAIKLYQEILVRNPKDETKAKVLTNLANAQWLQQPNFNPVPSYLIALAIRKRIGNQWGVNSSYSHLSDYYLKTKPDSALYYSRLMYKLALILGNPDNELEALRKLIELDAQKRLIYFKRYRQLDDSLYSIRNAAKNQFALIKYETEKHKSEKVRLEKENIQKKYEIARKTTALWIAILIAVVTVIGGVIFYRKRKQRLAEQAEKSIRENKLKVSKEIHDVVANGLYRMMSDVEYGDEINKEQLVGQMEDLYHKSRDISHAVVAKPDDYLERLTGLISSFSNTERKIVTVGLDESINKISESVKDEIFLVLQELLVNMTKHSQASHVVLRFVLQSKNLEINYRDNGIGIHKNPVEGTGLRNTETRITSLKGVFTFENHESGGLKVKVLIPLS
ncbi:tetratricopeptide repeat-containing sensor histidine kinase [Pedobacter montanisoli]|uniref:histidine kinase n=1 Tax=Pedobacter montanisoli TaxID=2923277 RepID=A0ABS9ZV97_9SPHI|nr:tetratricopeptide repeat protein [Pedobacter montanisoli]MCJ0742224.1 tetratricopeptide repeat protein [Pedobacter montanisoli]